jgi:hypothetical protein
MKYTKFLVIGFALCVFFARSADAQCYFVYSANYGVYNSESTDGTNIFTSVLTDGSASMTIGGGNCGPGYQIMQNQINSASHTPRAYNVVAGIGGWGTGTSNCVNCYLSYQNDQNFTAAADGTEYEFDWTGDVLCTVGGEIFSSGGGNGFLSIHRTTYKYVSVANDICTYSVFCPTSPHICGLDTVTVQAPCTQTYFLTSWLKVRVGIYSTCFPGLTNILSNTPLACF